jgi:hypothetical protein
MFSISCSEVACVSVASSVTHGPVLPQVNVFDHMCTQTCHIIYRFLSWNTFIPWMCNAWKIILPLKGTVTLSAARCSKGAQYFEHHSADQKYVFFHSLV